MGYESNTGLNVNNHYGPRRSGGTEGVTRTEGVLNEFMWDLDEDGLEFGFPVPADGQPSNWVVEVDVSQVEGHTEGTDPITIGGVDVTGATMTAPVEIDNENTGVVVIGNATGGVALIRFKKYSLLKG